MRTLLIFFISLQMASMAFIDSEIEAKQYRHPATGLVFSDTIAGMLKGRITNLEERNGVGPR